MTKLPSLCTDPAALRFRLEKTLAGWVVWFMLGTSMGGAIFWP